MEEKEFNELLDITFELQDKADNARRTAIMIENWIDEIKNCEVNLEQARQMLNAARKL